MTNSWHSFVFCLLGPFLTPVIALSQSVPDTSFVQASTLQANDNYTRGLGTQSHLYNGVKYKEFKSTIEDQGMPYFESDDWLEGTVDYDGEHHQKVFIMYDVVKEKVIIENGIGGVRIQLIDEKLKSFTLPGHNFIHIVRDSIRNSRLSSGYYDLLSDGRAKFYVHWKRERLEVIQDQNLRAVFYDKDTYYLYRNGTYFTVRTKASVLKILNDNKNLRKFIRQNRLDFRNNRVKSIAAVVSYYNEQVK